MAMCQVYNLRVRFGGFRVQDVRQMCRIVKFQHMGCSHFLAMGYIIFRHLMVVNHGAGANARIAHARTATAKHSWEYHNTVDTKNPAWP